MNSGIVTNWSKTAPRFPWLTLIISLFCLGIKLLQSGMSPMVQQAMIEMAGVVPDKLALIFGQGISMWGDIQTMTLLSALFIHASWLHLLGNMAYLWVFGLPLERHLGWFGMLTVFMLGGAMANLIVALRLPELATPIIGASGAVSAVVGAYLGMFPSRRIGMLIPLGLYLQFARVPAILVIGSWFTLQLVYTLLGPITVVVAWWTHMTGFMLGLIFALLVRAKAQYTFG